MSKYNFDLDLNTRNSLSLIIKRIKPNSKVLEFGPAHGRMTKYLKEKLECDVYAVEIDVNAAKDAKEYCKEIIVGNIEDYEWLQQYKHIRFDYIVFADVLEHLYSPKKVLERSKQLLHEKGSILFSIPNIAHNVIIMELLEDRFTYHPVGILDDTHIRFFTKNSLDELVEKIGMYKTYETAVFVPPEHTEFHKLYENFSPIVSNMLEQRVFGEAYQYIYELKLSKVQLLSDLKYHREFKLFYDTGTGFNEEQVVVTEFENGRALFNLSDIDEKIQAIRIDPLERSVSFKLESLIIDSIDCKDQVEHNGIQEQDILNFYTSDPQLIIKFDVLREVKFVEIVLYDFQEIDNYLFKLINIKEQQIQEKEQQIQEKEQQIQEKEQQIQEKEQQIQEKEQQIQQLSELAESLRFKNRIKNLFHYKNSKLKG